MTCERSEHVNRGESDERARSIGKGEEGTRNERAELTQSGPRGTSETASGLERERDAGPLRKRGLSDISPTGWGEGVPRPGAGGNDHRRGGYGVPGLCEYHHWAARHRLYLFIISVIFKSPEARNERGGCQR